MEMLKLFKDLLNFYKITFPLKMFSEETPFSFVENFNNFFISIENIDEAFIL